MRAKQNTATRDRQTQLTEFKEYERTARALERLRQKYIEFILKLKGAKKQNESRNKNGISSVLFIRGSRRNQTPNLETKSHKNRKRVIKLKELTKENLNEDIRVETALRKHDIYKLWFDAVLIANKTECDHKHKGTEFESVNTTAWRRKGNFEKCREICTQCGKTVRTLIRIVKEA